MKLLVGAALAIAATACVGAPSPLAPGLRGSVGLPHHGVLTDSVELPVQGPGYVRFRRTSPHYWGTPRLVGTLERVAGRMTEVFPASPPLLIGDLSARQGGKISGHNSHRTGRDVDLLWYVTTPAGAPMRNPGFVRVESDGLARVHETGEYVRLDVERNWALVRELLNDEEAMVQWMFVSREVEALLVDYARARERDLSLIWHAQTVMLQPGDSAPHDDHIHLRLACAPHETVLGCEGGGPRWEWLPRHPELSLDDSQLAAIGDEDPFEAEPLASSALP